ncbi:hypothetical protein [Kitasatospora sp. NPDC094015]|uniref:hypothetical protein n=1 Tax=Kitasatospora sp. NPDC094015 TaxID=3155205 RepID=UPI0033280085
MGSTDRTTPSTGTPADRAAQQRGRGGRPAGTPWRYLPAAAAYLFLVALLLAADTSPGDIARYTGYVLWGVLLPGTLVFRALRRRPHTLVEDLAFGAVTGLVLELAAWAVLMPLGLQGAAIAWPLLVVVPFAAVPALRRHWAPRGYTRPSLGWSWAVAGTVAVTSAYLYEVFLRKNPVLPTGDATRQYIDLPYLLSLAGNAKHDFPLTFPQAAGEPLHYHWFTFVHMAMTSMVGHIDLPVVQMRLMVPALCALAMVITAVVAGRLTGRAWAGPAAALLVFGIGEFNAIYPNDVFSWTFGAPAVPLMSWASLSLTYSQPLLMALIGVVGDLLRRRGADPAGADPAGAGVPPLGRGAFVLAAMFAVASSAAKASSLPVTVAALAAAGLLVLVLTRRIPWTIVGLGAILGGAQLFATAVLFRFESYGLEVVPFGNVSRYWQDPAGSRDSLAQGAVVAATLAAFALNHQLRMAGAIPLIWRRRLRLEPVQWFLLGGALAGPAAYLVVNGFNSSYFTIAGLPFGVLLSVWGYCEVFERARLSTRAKALLAVGSVVFVAVLTWAVHRYSARWAGWVLARFQDGAQPPSYAPILPALAAAAALAAIAAVGGVLWWAAGRAVRGLRGRGGVVLLTAVLLAGGPTLLLDVAQARQFDWPGAWPLPGSQVEAARWVRSHSAPSDVLATNSHCRSVDDWAVPGESCPNALSFWLSGYSERSVLVEGWAYAPRLVSDQSATFWDQPLLQLNEDAVYHPTADVLRVLHERHHVRYLVVDRRIGPESPALAGLAERRYDNGRVAVYELR